MRDNHAIAAVRGTSKACDRTPRECMPLADAAASSLAVAPAAGGPMRPTSPISSVWPASRAGLFQRMGLRVLAVVALAAPAGMGCDDGGGSGDEDTADSQDTDVISPDPKCDGERNGTVCDDDNACTDDDKCIQEVCRGAQLTCDDGNSCTDDACDLALGCVNAPNADVCDDGDQCTFQDRCDAGSCGGTPTSDIACNDGNPCTSLDTCVAGSCEGTTVVCDDDNACTDDSCDSSHPLANAATGCVHVENTDPCDDGNSCSVGDICTAGACASGTDIGSGPCDDGNACTITDVCNAVGTCVGVTSDCDDSDVCTIDSCDPQFGCRNAPNEGERCDDNSLCTLEDTCDDDGVCVGVAKPCQGDDACLVGTCNLANGGCQDVVLDCDDSNPCTTDSCDPGSGCVNAFNSDPCNDDDACTTGDSCRQGSCGGDVVMCDESQDSDCRANLCDPVTGQCKMSNYDGSLCNDGMLCTNSDTCIGGACIGITVTCIDGDPCTVDSCVEMSGECLHEPIPPENCESLALDRSNAYRALIDLPLLRDHEAIIDAATAHCEYYVANPGPFDGGLSPHNEQDGLDGYTGAGFGERMRTAGYTGQPLFEIMAFVDDPIISVDEWVATLYHRIPYVVPNAYEMGYGAAREGGRACDTIDFGSNPVSDPEWEGLIIPFPPEGHAGVPTSWDGAENPQPPLPNPYPSGPILTVTFGSQTGSPAVRITDSDIHGPDGPIPHTANDESGDADLCCGVVTFYPNAPIAPFQTYTVAFDYTLNGQPGTYEWSFTTGGAGYPYFLPAVQ
ncbi:MAG: hypothetical protein ACI9MR_001690 [Myxococcota bacterium]|jgi:hypothetical protein